MFMLFAKIYVFNFRGHIMKIKTKHKSNRNWAFSIIFVPGSKHKARTLRIPKWTFIPLILLIAYGSYRVGRMQTNIHTLNQEIVERDTMIEEYCDKLDNSTYKVSSLKLDIASYNDRINSLLATSSILDQRISQLTLTNKLIIEEIGDLIGLKIDEADASQLSSRSSSESRPKIDAQLPKDPTFDQTYAVLAGQLLESDTDLTLLEDTTDQLKSKLENMRSYLKAYPSILPVQGKITSHVGYRRNPITGRGREFHSGLDLRVPRGTNVKATGAGRVSFSGYKGGSGYLVIIDHGYGIQTQYAHNSKLLVKKGDWVERGHIIAKSGNSGRSTGPHVHYELIINGQFKNPLDYILK